MSKLCIGSFIKILSGALNNGTKKYVFFGNLLKTFSNGNTYTENSMITGLVNWKYLYTIDIDKSEEEYISYFEKNIMSGLNRTKLPLIVVAFKDIIEKDSIFDDAIIGFSNSEYTKNRILKSNKFFLPELLANIFYYVGTFVNNRECSDSLKEMKSFNLDMYSSRADTIYLTNELIPTPGVKTTIKKNDFSKIFNEVYVEKTEFNNKTRIYVLDIVNNKFDYSKLESFILSNISRYVFDRASYNYYQKQDIEVVCLKAIEKYKEKIIKDNMTNQFDEIMLYSFLECVLDATKLFSKLELQDKSGQFETSASGIHLFTYSYGGKVMNQLVLGIASTKDKLIDSLNNIFIQISKVKDEELLINRILDNSVAKNDFDAKTTEFLLSVVFPTELNRKSVLDNSFGIFLWHSIDTRHIHETNPYLFKNALYSKMKEDIGNIIPEINKLIKDNNLENYPLHIFVLPLNGAVIDKEKIMKEALRY